MKVSWLEPAKDELDDAFSQYESVQEGLGDTGSYPKLNFQYQGLLIYQSPNKE